MKKIILSAILCAIASYGFSQTDEVRTRTNEIGLDIFDLAVFRTIDITYEYVKNADIGFGLTARYSFDANPDDLYMDTYEKYGITPFFRFYFLGKKTDYASKKFYVESFLKFFGGENDDYYSYSRREIKNYFDIALGVGLGYKFVNRNGFVVDINFGIGRSFDISDYSPNLRERGGILIGYRF